jgi:hypothetical protein
VTYQWEDELDRWHELLYHVANAHLGGEAMNCRGLINALAATSLITPDGLAQVMSNGSVDTNTPRYVAIHEVIKAAGVDDSKSALIIASFCNVATATRAKYGTIQQLLRRCGQAALNEMVQEIQLAELTTQKKTNAFAEWLQVTTELPIAVEDEGFRGYCDEMGYSVAEVVSAADQLHINLGVVDDLLYLYMTDRERKPTEQA